jgi:hypothetical protein
MEEWSSSIWHLMGEDKHEVPSRIDALTLFRSGWPRTLRYYQEPPGAMHGRKRISSFPLWGTASSYPASRANLSTWRSLMVII